MKNRIFTMLIGLLLSATLINCSSSTNYKTAKALGQNEGGSNQGSFLIMGNYSEDAGTLWGVPVLPEIMYRYAAVPNVVDIGVKLFPIGAEIDLKVQFLRGNFNMAIDAAFTYSTFSYSGLDVTYMVLAPTLLMTMDVTPGFSLTLAPKLLYTIVTAAAGGYSGNVTSISYGGALTLDIGKAVGVMPEFSYFLNNTTGEGTINFGVGLRLGGYVSGS
ncbi:MAG: hypothetical protein ABUK01_10595 [Leptospirales bacterium]